MFTAFNPSKHKGMKLFEVQSKDVDGDIVSNYMPSDVAFEDAAKIPWFFVVETSKPTKKLKLTAKQ